MKKTITTIKMLIVIALAMVVLQSHISVAHAPTLYDIAPIATEAQNEETNEFVERALQVSEGYDFVEYISINDVEVIYIVEDDNGFQYKVAYTETNGNPVSGITLYSVPQN